MTTHIYCASKTASKALFLILLSCILIGCIGKTTVSNDSSVSALWGVPLSQIVSSNYLTDNFYGMSVKRFEDYVKSRDLGAASVEIVNSKTTLFVNLRSNENGNEILYSFGFQFDDSGRLQKGGYAGGSEILRDTHPKT